MAELVVLGFPTREQAERVMEVAEGLRRQELLDLEDAALVWRTPDGKIKSQQAFSTTGAGAATGALWGTLLGLLFFVPVFGLAVVSRETNTEQGVREAMLVVSGEPSASYVQLLEPLGPETPVGKFIAKRGEGMHHVGYAVDSVTEALESIGAERRTSADRREAVAIGSGVTRL